MCAPSSRSISALRSAQPRRPAGDKSPFPPHNSSGLYCYYLSLYSPCLDACKLTVSQQWGQDFRVLGELKHGELKPCGFPQAHYSSQAACGTGDRPGMQHGWFWLKALACRGASSKESPCASQERGRVSSALHGSWLEAGWTCTPFISLAGANLPCWHFLAWAVLEKVQCQKTRPRRKEELTEKLSVQGHLLQSKTAAQMPVDCF